MLNSGKRLIHAKPIQTLRELRWPNRTPAPLGKDAGVRALSFAARAAEATQPAVGIGNFLVIPVWRRRGSGCLRDALVCDDPCKESTFNCGAGTGFPFVD